MKRAGRRIIAQPDVGGGRIRVSGGKWGTPLALEKVTTGLIPQKKKRWKEISISAPGDKKERERGSRKRV